MFWGLYFFFHTVFGSTKPNILFILADDYGWNNVGYHNPSREVSTPNINELVKNGVELDRHYAYSECSPSRSSIQSGRYPNHVNAVNVDPLRFNPDDKVGGYPGVPPKMTIIPSKLKEAGYETAFTGKWDIGMVTTSQTPRRKGYDKFLGYLHHANSYCSQRVPILSVGTFDICQNRFYDLWLENETYSGPSFLAGTRYEEEIFSEHTLGVINKHDTSKPLFMFHAFHLLHSPLQIPEVWLKNFTFMEVKGRSDELRRQYNAMVQYMDNEIGKFVNALKSRRMWDNTLLVFVSDNGGPTYMSGGASNAPLRGGKLSDWEGGIRVNAFVSGGFIPASVRGTINPGLSHIADWFTTFCTIAGVDPEDSSAAKVGLPPVDGINLWPMITGQKKSVRNEVYISRYTLISGDMKLIIGTIPFTHWSGPTYPNNTCSPCRLGKCADCPQPGFNSGYWLPCTEKGCFSSRNADATSDSGGSYPKSMESWGGWTHNCTGPGKIGCLFNLTADPTEHVDLIAQPGMDKIASQMQARLQELHKTNFDPNRGDEAYIGCIQFFRYGGYYGPFLDDDGVPLHQVNGAGSPPSCDICDTVTSPSDQMCVYYPSFGKGYTCTPYVNGKCGPHPESNLEVRGENAPINAVFLCGKGDTSWARNYTLPKAFTFGETAQSDVVLQAMSKTNNSNEWPFEDVCKPEGISEQPFPPHI